MSMSAFNTFQARSLSERDAFWREQSALIDWHTPPAQVCDFSHPPFARWFSGGTTNLCHNALDRWLPTQADKPALIFISTETGIEKTWSFRELHAEVVRCAAMLKALGVVKGDRVLIYMPMIAEAAFAMLACARIGAIHSVVFGGFASHSLASRIDDARPKVIVSADAGSRAGKVVPYKGLLDEAINLSKHKPAKVLLFDRKLAAMPMTAGRDVDWATLAQQVDAQGPAQVAAQAAIEWLESSEPSYILYTSGTTGTPKGVQRDTGGYAVALAASMKHIYDGHPGETYFSTSDIGWVVGHSYIIYGPLIAGMATIMYEGTPVRPDAGILWKIVQDYKVAVMFSAPTAIRVLKKQDPAYLSKYDLSSLKTLWLAGEPLDEPTARWISESLGRPVVDNYWQTETGWPILTYPIGFEQREVKNAAAHMPRKFGSPGVPMYGYNVKILHETTGEEVGVNEKGVVTIVPPLPPGCMTTIWGDDARFVKTYFDSVPGQQVYSTFDWGIRDADGCFFILGRTDDVINVAGHRLGTREIEESISSHAAIAEVAVVGVADQLKGQVPVGFAVLKDANLIATPAARLALEGDVMKTVDSQLGGIARPSRIHFVTLLPKTRSGKVLRRSIQAICEGRDPGDLTTIEDPSALQQVVDAVSRAPQ